MPRFNPRLMMISDHGNHCCSKYLMEWMVIESVSLWVESMENFSTMDATLSQQFLLMYPNDLMACVESSL